MRRKNKQGDVQMIVIKVNLLFLAMASDRDHEIPEILKIDDKFCYIFRDDPKLPDVLEYAGYFAELESEVMTIGSYEYEMHKEAKIFCDFVEPVMIEKWEKWDA